MTDDRCCSHPGCNWQPPTGEKKTVTAIKTIEHAQDAHDGALFPGMHPD